MNTRKFAVTMIVAAALLASPALGDVDVCKCISAGTTGPMIIDLHELIPGDPVMNELHAAQGFSVDCSSVGDASLCRLCRYVTSEQLHAPTQTWVDWRLSVLSGTTPVPSFECGSRGNSVFVHGYRTMASNNTTYRFTFYYNCYDPNDLEGDGCTFTSYARDTFLVQF